MATTSQHAFTPPSPGSWELEQTHMTKPPSILIGELLPAQMMRGFSEGTRHDGILLDYLDVAIRSRGCGGRRVPRSAAPPETER